MADKKSVRRFTIQFNRKDPAHLRVADILNRLEWRGKAQYVVNAVLCYIKREDSSEAVRPVLDEKHIEAVVRRMLRGWRENGMGGLPVPLPAGTDDGQTETIADISYSEAVEALGEDRFDAIAGALDMFRRK